MEFCRLCLTATNLKINLESLDDHTIIFRDKLKIICDIKINENDILPTSICNLCEIKVQQFFEFKQMCLQSNLLLNKHKDELNKLFIYKLRKKILSEFNIDSKENNIDDNSIDIISDNQTKDDLKLNNEELVQQSESEEVTREIIETKLKPQTDTTIRCHICDLILENSDEFGNHITIHIHPNADGKFQCGKCEKTFGNKLSLRRHITGFVKDCPYKCAKCDKIYHLRVSYINHMKKHEPNQICAKCGQSFPTVSLLKRHELTHSPDKPYQCHICSQEMKHKSSYNTHMKRHKMTPEERNARKFSCELCGKTYRTLDNLNIHKISHTTEKTHECTQCGKKFKYSRCLKNHEQIIHFGKRSICTICGKTCVTGSVLKRHMRLHTGEQPYKCHLCSRAFCDQSNYYGHMLTHSNMRTQVCKYCGMQFKQRNYLYHHIKKKHSDAKNELESNEITAEK